MGFEDFKLIETAMVKVEEKILPDIRDEQRAARRTILKKEIAGRSSNDDTTVDIDENNEYFVLLRQHAKEENDMLRKISKSVVAHFGIGPDVYQGWIETYLEKLENRKKLEKFRESLRNMQLKSRNA